MKLQAWIYTIMFIGATYFVATARNQQQLAVSLLLAAGLAVGLVRLLFLRSNPSDGD